MVVLGEAVCFIASSAALILDSSLPSVNVHMRIRSDSSCYGSTNDKMFDTHRRKYLGDFQPNS